MSRPIFVVRDLLSHRLRRRGCTFSVSPSGNTLMVDSAHEGIRGYLHVPEGKKYGYLLHRGWHPLKGDVDRRNGTGITGVGELVDRFVRDYLDLYAGYLTTLVGSGLPGPGDLAWWSPVGSQGVRIELQAGTAPVARVLLVSQTDAECRLPWIRTRAISDSLHAEEGRPVALIARWNGTNFRSGQPLEDVFLDELVPYVGPFPVPDAIDAASRHPAGSDPEVR